MTVTIYIDTLFVLNTIINYLLLLAAARIADRPVCRRRLLLGAALGGIYAVLVFLPPLRFLAGLTGKALAGLLMALCAAGGQPWKRFWRYTLVFVGVSFALGGCVLALGLLTGQRQLQSGVPVLPISLPTLLLGAGGCYLLLTLVFRRAARHGGMARDIVAAQINWDGREVELPALCDTGNTLSDPLTGAPVMVADYERARPVLPGEAALLMDRSLLKQPERFLPLLYELGLSGRFRLIPYQAVGVDCAFLLAFRPDSVCIGGKRQKGLLVALSPTRLSDGAAYAAIFSA